MVSVIDERSLLEFVTAQRWFGAPTADAVQARLLDRIRLGEGGPELELELVEVGFASGRRETYQLVAGGSRDALDDPSLLGALPVLMGAGASVAGRDGAVEFSAAGPDERLLRRPATVRAIDGEQTHSSVVFDERLILKLYRRLSPGPSPELELLRFLAARGFEHIAPVLGWYAYAGSPLGSPFDATLGILQELVAGDDGWELALATMADGAGGIVQHVRRLGAVTGTMHSLLASDEADPAFGPEQAPAEAFALLASSLGEAADRIFRDLPGGESAVEALRGRRRALDALLRRLARPGDAGRLCRGHGDLHLGQALWTGDDWVLVDFEGEPARPVAERRRKRTPLRDVAGLLRSLAYAAAESERSTGTAPPAGWEREARAELLAGYRAAVDPSLVPRGGDFDRLLVLCELERLLYELRYELDNRPGWLGIPAAGLVRLLDERGPR